MGLFPNQIIKSNDYDIEPTYASLRYRQDEAKVNQGQMALTHWQLHIFAFYFPLSSNTILNYYSPARIIYTWLKCRFSGTQV